MTTKLDEIYGLAEEHGIINLDEDFVKAITALLDREVVKAKKAERELMANQLLEVADRIEYVDPGGYHKMLWIILRENNDLPATLKADTESNKEGVKVNE